MKTRTSRNGTRLYVGSPRIVRTREASQVMANARNLTGHRTLRCLVLPLCAALVLGGYVALSNATIKSRCRLDDLRADKAYLQTCVGLLERQWLHDTSREVITERADLELGLAVPEAPGRIMVVDSGRRSGESGR